MLQARLTLDTQFNVGAIDRRIFGGFLEHMGRAVYEGVFDPGNAFSDSEGFRQDVLESLRPLGMPVIRYPGGNFVSTYDWTDGIGPQARRPRRPDFAWKSIETNQFGVDEYMHWLRQLGANPMLTVNLGTGTPASAAALLEYCNLSTGSYWADQRAHNGSPDPYGVALWCLGNEMDGPWQAGHVPVEVYAQRAHQTSQLMKGLDPSIETILCGSSNETMSTYLRWDAAALDFCWETVDYLSAHRYSENRRGDSAWFLAEGVAIDRILDEYAALLTYMRGVKKSKKRTYLSFDEWNVWYKNMEMDGHGSSAPHLIEEVYNLEDALVCAQYLNSFIRHADVVKIACIAQIANVIAPILTRPDGLLKQTIYYPFALYSQTAAGVALTPIVASPSYRAGERGEAPVLDASACYDAEQQRVTIYLVNRKQDEELDVVMALADCQIAGQPQAWVFGGHDVRTANTWEEPDRVLPTLTTAMVSDDGSLRVSVPAPGLAVISANVTPR